MYGIWAGDVVGKSYIPGRCAYEINKRGAIGFQQCEHCNGHGPDYLYCRQHAKMIERETK